MRARLLLAPLFVLATLPLGAADCGPEEGPTPDDYGAGCAAVLCGPGTYCEEIDGEPWCVADEAATDEAPYEPAADAPATDEAGWTACLEDADCDAGLRCDFENYCDRPPGCAPESFCPAVCWGRCVDDTGTVVVPQ